MLLKSSKHHMQLRPGKHDCQSCRCHYQWYSLQSVGKLVYACRQYQQLGRKTNNATIERNDECAAAIVHNKDKLKRRPQLVNELDTDRRLHSNRSTHKDELKSSSAHEIRQG